MSTLRCLIRQSFKKRMSKMALLWDKDGRLLMENDLESIQNLPKSLFFKSPVNSVVF